MDFTGNEKPQIEEMLREIGVSSIGELFCDIPDELLVKRPDKDDGLSEFEGIQRMEVLAKKNRTLDVDCYLGGGSYEHHVPALSQAICQKSEFLTAYTPYQAEASQGMLQIIFEFQSMICALTGLDVSNASLYDGASACAEAVLMSLRCQKKKTKLLIAGSLNPHYRAVINQYTMNQDVDIVEIPLTSEGLLDSDFIEENLDENTAGLMVQYPNFLGSIDDIQSLFQKSSALGAMNLLCANPIVYGLYQSAEELGADIAVGECQPLGIPMQYGGPYAGYISCREKYLRQLPGRIVGETVDTKGKRGYVLTLQAREQHIRREKATSNICTNQSLCALSALVSTLWYGPEGLKELALSNYRRAAYLKKSLEMIPGINALSSAPHLNEFVITLVRPIDEVLKYFSEHEIVPGISLERYFPQYGNSLLVAVTETKNKSQIDKYISVMEAAMTQDSLVNNYS
ncbi:MAG: aminomethyl-transferring glycine dehydrogenase subunit GcvPA [Chlamydiota bacterium]